MLNSKQLLDDLKKVVTSLEKDLAARSDSAEVPQVQELLQAEYERAQKSERTALSYEKWRADYATQVAVAWVLGAVFVRFLEDNELIESPKLSGAGERLQRARDEHELYFRSHPTETDREYLLAVFGELGQLPGMGAIFLEQNPIFELPNWLSGDAAGELLKFFQKIDPATGLLVHDFTDPDWDTRFLGDLYQDLSEAARKKYALLQTPIFVEEFILDRTLNPAIEEFGLEGFRMIDPACGSGHFLLGAFARILDRWQKLEPGTNVRTLAQRGLDAVHGVDVNPYAVAIARFRLLLAAMRASGIEALRNAPGFKFRLACGDSLLHGEGSQLVLGDWAPMAHHFQTENIGELNEILRAGYYHAVVANPPYITPKDRALNKLYRKRYETCHMKYSLAVPFLERIFQLAVPGGFTGQITANSFMKREFGKKLIEQFFPKVDLTHVIDTSGAYIPGHGTPTVILFGRNRAPIASVIRTVMGIRGEPATPEDAAKGLVWSAILQQVDVEGAESEFVSVADSQRDLFHKHPWSIGGGGASELKDFLDQNHKLEKFIDDIGFMTIISEDDAYVVDASWTKRYAIPHLSFGTGEHLRDWSFQTENVAIFPYLNLLKSQSLKVNRVPDLIKHFWSYRTPLRNRLMFGKRPEDRGMEWYEFMHLSSDRFSSDLLIAFASVATHGQFWLRRDSTLLNRHAPVIKLPAGATEDEHLALMGLLNSSTACFWMKQVFYPKATSTGDISAEKGKPESNRYEFAGTGLKSFPLPFTSHTSVPDLVLEIAKELDQLAQKLLCLRPQSVVKNWSDFCENDLQALLKSANQEHESAQKRMMALQEELDWEVYKAFGLTESGASEIVLKDQSCLISANERPFAWSADTAPQNLLKNFKYLYEERRQTIKRNKNIGLIEDVIFKRPWWGRQGVYGRLAQDYAGWTSDALSMWLLDRLESYFDFDGRMNDEGNPTAKIADPTLISTAKLADIASQDSDFLKVGELYRNDPAFNVQTLIDELVDKQTVPLHPSLRYKTSGLRKRQDWEQTWQLQRQEDAIDARTQLPKEWPNHLDTAVAKRLKETEIGTIPVPPKYATKDFAKGHYWSLRGKLDVPKERWVSFPHCEGPDGLPVIAWAGYDHLQLTTAIAAYYMRVKEEFGGSDDPRLIPLLGCLLELLPWVKQWHNDLDPTYGLKMGDYYEDFIQEEARQQGKTLDEIRAWEPPPTPKRKRKRKAAASAK